MDRQKYIVSFLIWLTFLGLHSCSNHTEVNSSFDKIFANNSSKASQQTNASTNITLALQKGDLTKIYTQAIAEFLKATYKKNKIAYDTLYFGKHVYGQKDDFPEIELPDKIGKTQIILIEPEQGQKKQIKQKSLVYVNMIAWVDKEIAEFIFVVFTNGGEHQFDYFINFIANSSSNKFELHKIEFENYLQLNGQKPRRIIVYENGNYAKESTNNN